MRNLNTVHLNALRALEAAGRLGSLAAAAEELGVTIGAVSQQIGKAEAQLARSVFARTPKGLRPTPFGQMLLSRLSQGFATLDAAVASARRSTDSILTISVAPVFASKWLVPRLSDFAARHPGMQVRLDATTTLIDPDASDIDVAIRVGPGRWPGVRKEYLLDQEVFPVCAPELAKRIARPADLLTVPVVRDANSNVPWRLWLEPEGLDEKELLPGNSFNDAALALDAAIAGQGVMLAWPTLAHYALKVGTLVAPFARRAKTGNGYYMVTSQNRPEEQKVTRFKAWLREEIEQTRRDFR